MLFLLAQGNAGHFSLGSMRKGSAFVWRSFFQERGFFCGMPVDGGITIENNSLEDSLCFFQNDWGTDL